MKRSCISTYVIFSIICSINGADAWIKRGVRGSSHSSVASENDQESEIENMRQERRDLYYGGQNTSQRSNYYYNYGRTGRYYTRNNNGGRYYNTGRTYNSTYTNYYAGDDVTDDNDNSTPLTDDSTFSSKWSKIESQAEAEAQALYSTPPSEWTGQEWGIVAGVAVAIISFILCLCSCCFGWCCSRKDWSKDKKEYMLDEYTSVGSWGGKSYRDSKSSEWDESQDDSTYDSIMRRRSMD